MNKKLTLIISVIIIGLACYFTYYITKTEKVLVSGKVFGFNIQDTETKQDNKRNSIVPTSLKKVGTMTFKKIKNDDFAALGHSIKEMKNKEKITGDCYEILLDEIEKGTLATPGQIVAELNEDKKIGRVESANDYGLFGEVYNTENENLVEMQTSNRYEVKIGNAEVWIDFDGNGTKKYEIVINDINHISQNRNIKFKVTSDELIEKAGGIVQGMSGAPIIQNGKLVGAVNYVSLDNPQEAYGIFIDKLI